RDHFAGTLRMDWVGFDLIERLRHDSSRVLVRLEPVVLVHQACGRLSDAASFGGTRHPAVKRDVRGGQRQRFQRVAAVLEIPAPAMLGALMDLLIGVQTRGSGADEAGIVDAGEIGEALPADLLLFTVLDAADDEGVVAATPLVAVLACVWAKRTKTVVDRGARARRNSVEQHR